MKIRISIAIIILFGVYIFATTALAQTTNRPDTILILDASGSMWGQIEGVNKIVIAKDVVEGLVRGLHPEQRLGFVAYGHRREGDCNDIETLAEIGNNRDGVISSLRNLTARGKTPLSKSVEHAATALDFTRKAASIILVSDGLENCDLDPCALARKLEKQGFDLSVHVIGFDVTREEREGLECIAAETGGTFVAADNADELAGALSSVTGGDKPPADASDPAPSTLIMKATVLSGGPLIQSKLDWKVTSLPSNEVVFEMADTGSSDTLLVPGNYSANAAWSGWKDGSTVKYGELHFEIKPQQTKVITLPIDLGLNVTLSVPTEVVEGAEFDVTWTGPDDLGAYIHVASPDDGPRRAIYFLTAERSRNAAGITDVTQPATAKIGAPSNAGDYEVRYVLDRPRLILARQSLKVLDGEFLVVAPEKAAASSIISVNWSGKSTPGDFVTIIEAGSKSAFNNGFTTRVSDGDTVQLTVPPKPGAYEVRYILANGYTTYPNTQHTVQASTPVEVVDVTAAVSGPTEVVGGSQVDIEVDLPKSWEDDVVSIASAGARKPNRDASVALHRAGIQEDHFSLQAPNIEGDYELIYFLVPGNRPIARQPIKILRATASVEAPANVQIGQNFEVKYSGPAYRGDRIVIVPTSVPDFKMWGWGTRYGFGVKPGATEATGEVNNYQFAKAGTYEARYVTGLQHVVLARATFTVTE